MSQDSTNSPLPSPFNQTQVFDKTRVRRAFDRAAHSYEQFAVLQNEVCSRLLEKLDVVKMKPAYILDAGTGTGAAVPTLFAKYKKAQVVTLDLSEKMLGQAGRHGNFFRAPHLVCADIERLPFEDDVFDLVFSSLSMQWCNDLNAALLEAKRVLKPGGLFVFSTFGPDTLKELRHSWAKVDAVNHVNHFIDMHDIGDALLQDGYAEPVMECEIMTVTYDTVDEIMHDLKAIGANVTAQSTSNGVTSSNAAHTGKGLNGKSVLQTVREGYESFRQNEVLPATYEIIYGHAWKPIAKKASSNEQYVNFER